VVGCSMTLIQTSRALRFWRELRPAEDNSHFDTSPSPLASTLCFKSLYSSLVNRIPNRFAIPPISSICSLRLLPAGGRCTRRVGRIIELFFKSEKAGVSNPEETLEAENIVAMIYLCDINIRNDRIMNRDNLLMSPMDMHSLIGPLEKNVLPPSGRTQQASKGEHHDS
jgi:hypothetical protein